MRGGGWGGGRGDGGGAFCNSPQVIPQPAPALYVERGSMYVCVYIYMHASAKLEQVLKYYSGEFVAKKHCVRSYIRSSP